VRAPINASWLAVMEAFMGRSDLAILISRLIGMDSSTMPTDLPRQSDKL
jgi:hypothetical protein